ncbi:MAG: hypothetical protein P8X83_06615, partial [Nitrosopumilaceae archaeon]
MIIKSIKKFYNFLRKDGDKEIKEVFHSEFPNKVAAFGLHLEQTIQTSCRFPLELLIRSYLINLER